MKAKLFLLPLMLLLVSCSKRESVVMPALEDYINSSVRTEQKSLRVGVVAGPYGNMFMEAIQPSLIQKGYSTELVFYDDYVMPNFALARNEIDINIFQHYIYLNRFKFENDLDLSAVTEIPTVSMGIYSKKYETSQDVINGATVSIPKDASNLSRALIVLEAAGLITLDGSIDKTKAEEKHITGNPKQLRFEYIDAQNIVESLEDNDLAIIDGNFAFAGGLDSGDALYIEILTENYINVIAVRTGDLKEQFVRDLIDVVYSSEYIHFFDEQSGKYSDFQLPPYFTGIKNKEGDF